ncbi:AAA family ATPase [Pseudomonas oryzihabitans]|uniref:AAA family ATPase n=1 Tax=Pseudomonas oryzihabitans TaxID=47885 RepID=UPI00214E2FFB|nr:AAA family ATPase [Pseudomonas psychrotolerans]UUW72002.1 AAA family ATPase [Pseudomonas psychrotolerans]
MIESITLSDIATYSSVTPEMIQDLKTVNYFYGANGAGKTTISRLIGEPALSPASKVTWAKGNPIPAMVYNNDFIAANFTDSKQFKGVFTLGKTEKAQLDRLEALQRERRGYEQVKTRAQENLKGLDGESGKIGEKKALEAKLLTRCWEQKQKHDKDFQIAFSGLRNNKEAFKSRVLQECRDNTSQLAELEDLRKRAEVLYRDAPSIIITAPSLDLSRLVGLQQNPVLSKKVLGKEDVSVSAMIQHLGNSDWIRQGMKYLGHTDDDCPFCQQKLPHDFEKRLEDYFDETFEADTRALSQFRDTYRSTADTLLAQAQTLLTTDCKHLDKEKFETELHALNAIILVNRQRIDQKIASPSIDVALEDLAEVTKKISKLINSANLKISEHNRLVSDFSVEQKKLTGSVWRYLLDVELKDTLTDYTTDINRISKAIAGISASLDKAELDISKADAEIASIETSLTSVRPTVIAINKILKDFGFRSFSLDTACTENSYRLIRSDGTDAKATLSEGEKTFVTFLYFYHLLRGSITTSGINTDRIVVIDDPVSSLDSDVLFIVSSLIKKLFHEARQKGNNIKQVFVLTHNVHFHKEITFNPQRAGDDPIKDETFWIVRKPDYFSRIEKFETNPIKTSYQLLWAELAKNPLPTLTIQNTMRRILENYFKILGNTDTNVIIGKLEGQEKVQCQSLISWVNDGSHYSPDELYVAISDGMAHSYMRIFFKIFKIMGHMPHYKMMMGRNFVDLDPAEDETEDEDSSGDAGDATIETTTSIIVSSKPSSENPTDPAGTTASLITSMVATRAPKPYSVGTDDSGSDSDIPF